MALISIKENDSKNPVKLESGQTPAHWLDGKCESGFHNPWPSWRATTPVEMLSLFFTAATSFPNPKQDDIKRSLPVKTPTWGLDGDNKSRGKDSIRTTWLGHACFLAEFPTRREDEAGRGVRILFDPVFSHRCSPFTFLGPKRFTPPPCKVEEIPEIDAIVISHNHYDHMDTATLQTLYKRSPDRPPMIFAPLGNAPYLRSIGVPETSIHVMDWWDSKRLTIDLSSSLKSSGAETSTPGSFSVDITCTPCQHFTGRSLTDRFKTLWSGWVVEEVAPTTTAATAETSRAPLKLFFGGDTGYRSVMDGQNEDEVPVCPAFKQVGEVFGGFDVAMIPIGAYLPRQFMSPIHCAPQDSVRLFQDIKAKKAVGMHWGTWVLTTEDVFEPPKKLAEEAKKIGIPEGDFTVCDIGETLFFH